MYKLWYRTGGTVNYQWHPTHTRGDDITEVTRSGTDVRRAGYPTVTLPEGTEPCAFAPEGIKEYTP